MRLDRYKWSQPKPARRPFLHACGYVAIICAVAMALTYFLHLIGWTLR